MSYAHQRRRVLKPWHRLWPVGGTSALVGASALSPDVYLVGRRRRGAVTVNKAEVRRRLVGQPSQLVAAGSHMGAETQTWPEQSRWKSNLLGQRRRVDGWNLFQCVLCLASQLVPALTATKMNSKLRLWSWYLNRDLLSSACWGFEIFFFLFDAKRSKVS